MTTPPGSNPRGTPPDGQPAASGGQPPVGGQPPPPPPGQPFGGDSYGQEQPPHGQPGYGQPYGAPAPSGRSKVPLILTGLVVVLAAVGVGLYFFLFSGSNGNSNSNSNKTDTASPEDVVRSYWQAAQDNDVSAGKKVACKELQDSLTNEGFISEGNTVESFTVDKPTEEPTSRGTKVPTRLKIVQRERKSYTQSLNTKVIKENGEFRVCGLDDFRIIDSADIEHP